MLVRIAQRFMRSARGDDNKLVYFLSRGHFALDPDIFYRDLHIHA